MGDGEIKKSSDVKFYDSRFYKIKDERIMEIIYKIESCQVEDDEWQGMIDDMKEYIRRDDVPEDVKVLFSPLGYLEAAGMILDGIEREKVSICRNCKRRYKDSERYSCEIYPDRIPNEIWANKDATCSYRQEE